MAGVVSYCVDSSTLIDLARLYPRRVFVSLWENLTALGSKGRLFAPDQVYAEIERQGDALARWARANRRVFRRRDADEFAAVREILGAFPRLVDSLKSVPDADPFVIAFAVVFARRRKAQLFPAEEECVVVKQERARPGDPKIPSVCAHYKVAAVHHLEFFEMEGWNF